MSIICSLGDTNTTMKAELQKLAQISGKEDNPHLSAVKEYQSHLDKQFIKWLGIIKQAKNEKLI